METLIRRAAKALKAGCHPDVDEALNCLEKDYTLSDLQQLLQILPHPLSSNASDNDAGVYVHFLALKLFRHFVMFHRNQWVDQGAEVINFLLGYGKQICCSTGGNAVSRVRVDGNVEGYEVEAMRPVLAELASTIAVTLKLRCVCQRNEEDSAATRFPMSDTVKGLLSLLADHASSPAHSGASSSFVGVSGLGENVVVLHRAVVQRTVEEFGLFDRPSRRRGLPIRVHILWRRAMETEGLRSITECVGNLVLQPLSQSQETLRTLAAALSALVTCLSWYKHRFVDAEEDAAEEDTTDTFEVTGDGWGSLLLGHRGPTGEYLPQSSLAYVLLHRFNDLISKPMESSSGCSNGNQGGGAANVAGPNSFPLHHAGNLKDPLLTNIVQCIRLLCSFRVSDAPPLIQEMFISSHFTLCLRMLESSIHLLNSKVSLPPHEVEALNIYQGFIPVICNGLRRLVSNFTEFFVQPSSQSILFDFSNVTELLLLMNQTAFDEEDPFLGSIEEILSAWLTIVFLQERSTCSEAPDCVSSTTTRVLAAYVKMTMKAMERPGGDNSDEDTSSHTAVLKQTCYQIAGRLGRLAAPQASLLFREVLKEVSPLLVNHYPALSDPNFKWRCEAAAHSTRVILRLLLSFIGDPSDGEQPCIPRVFLDLNTAERGLLPLIEDIVNFYSSIIIVSPVLQQTPVVYDAYADLLERFVRVYIEPEESNAVYNNCFNKGLDVLSFSISVCLDYLQRFPGMESLAICRLFSAVSDKSLEMRASVASLPVFLQLVQVLKNENQHPLHPSTRGRIAACVATCVSPVDLFQCTPELSSTLTQNLTMEKMLYNTECLIGMAQFFRRADVLQSQFSSFLSIAGYCLDEAFRHLDLRQGVISALKLSREMFTAFSAALDDSAVQSLLNVLVTAMNKCVLSLQSVSTWYDCKEGVEERHQLLQSMAGMLYEIALWKALDCFLSDQEIAGLESTTMNTLAFMFKTITPEERQIPDLCNALYNALEHCGNSFTATFVNHPQSSSFMEAILFCIHHDNNPSVQLVGVHVISTVSSFLICHTNQTSSRNEVFSSFVRMLLRAIIHGQTTFRNTKHLCRTILKISRKLSEDDIRTIFQDVLEMDRNYEGILGQLYNGLQYTSAQFTSDADINQACTYFEEIAENSIATLDRISASNS